MTQLAILAASFVAVLLTALAVHWAGYGDGRLVDQREAAALAEAMVPGFVAEEALACAEGAAALVRGQRDGSATLVVLKRVGNRFAARSLPAPCKLERDGARLRIDSGDRMFGTVHIACGEDARRWMGAAA